MNILGIGNKTYDNSKEILFYDGYDLIALYDKKYNIYLINIPNRFDKTKLLGKNFIIKRDITSLHSDVIVDFVTEMVELLRKFSQTRENKYIEHLKNKYRDFQKYLSYYRQKKYKFAKNSLRNQGWFIKLIRQAIKHPEKFYCKEEDEQ